MTSTVSPELKRRQLTGWITDECAPRQLLTSLAAAGIISLFQVVFVLSLAALIFDGDLTAQLSSVLPALLIGNGVLVASVALLSSYGGSIATGQDAPGVILALAAAALAAEVSGSSQSPVPTILLLIGGATVTLGLVYLALGIFKLGGFVRFVPVPVMGGFLAATGWLLLSGGIGVAVELTPGATLFQSSALVRWLPALLLGIVLWLALRRWSGPLSLLAILIGAGGVFYGVMWLCGVPFARLADEGWLLGPFPHDVAWRWPVTADSVAQVHWRELVASIPQVAPAILVSVLAILVNASSMELVVKQDVDVNRELLAAGVANLLAGVTGGLMGYHSVGTSALNHTIGGGRRLPGLLAALALGLIAVYGTTLLSVVPRILLAGLLIYLGVVLLYEWVVKAWFAFSRPDFAVIAAILITIVTAGFVWGVGLGLVLAVILFVVSYSRISTLRYELSGTTFHSRVSRSPREMELLQAHGDQLVIYALHGFLFFGTAHQLVERVRERISNQREPVRYVVLDFGQVSGVDSTAQLSFQKLVALTQGQHIAVILSGLSERVRRQLQADSLTVQNANVRLEATLDRGVEVCEEWILADVRPLTAASATLEAQLPPSLAEQADIVAVIRRMERREVGAGEQLMAQGAASTELFVLESGQVTAWLEQAGRAPVRLETMQGGRMVGEVGFFLGTRRTASVVADRPSVVYVMNQREWTQLARTRPEAAHALTTLVLHLMGQRVAHLTRVVEAMQY